MPKFEDLTGNTYGLLTVISFAGIHDHAAYWNCRCSCKDETIITVRTASLKNGNTKSCGCTRREKTIERSTTHGKRHEPIYGTWRGIKTRCTNPNTPNYHNYGGRGIKLFPAWYEFQPFYDYVSKLPHFGEEGYSLDRIDNNGNYEPGNLRWATAAEQSRNYRRNVIVEYEGETLCLKDAAEKSGISYVALKSRYERGDRGERLFRPIERR